MRNYFGSGAKRTDHATSRTYHVQEGDIAPDMPWRVKLARPAIRSRRRHRRAARLAIWPKASRYALDWREATIPECETVLAISCLPSSVTQRWRVASSV